MNEEGLMKTPLYDLHLELGARMVEFAGYQMPVQYPPGIVKEHQHTRAAAGLFDVSHMGQVRLVGDKAAAALERLVPVDVIGLATNRQRYALFTNERGGILDDLMITNTGDDLFLVINAACKAQDIEHLQQLSDQCDIEVLDNRGLLALQGPEASTVMSRLCPAAVELLFMQTATTEIQGIPCFISRSGYTGEDGFEISVAAEQTEALARLLLDQEAVEAIGLGARDSLRLEAGLCLYGHDLDSNTTPIEANLNWALSKARRDQGERPGGYPGANVIHDQQANGADRKRVGLKPQGRAPVREGAELVDHNGNTVGTVTSGGFSPSLGGPVAMGYVSSDLSDPGTALFALVRGKQLDIEVVTLPFVEQRYYRG